MLKFVLLLSVSAVAGYLLYAGFKYTRMIGGIFMSLVYRPNVEPVTSFRGEPLTILDSSDHEIPALLHEVKDSRRVVIFCHESGSSRESWERYAYFLPDYGYTVLSFDFEDSAMRQSSQNTLSQWPTGEHVSRLRTVIRWVKKRFGKDIRLALFGVSNGADIALAAGNEDPGVRAVVSDGLFSMKEVFRDYIRRWAPILVRPNIWGERYPAFIVNLFADLGFWYSQRKAGKCFVDTEALLKRRRKPLLLIHGADDDYVPVTHQEFLRKLAGRAPHAQELNVVSAGHNQAVQVARRNYETVVTEFLKNYV